MKRVYVAHAFGEDRDNKERARRWFRFFAEIGHAPEANWIVLTDVWDESRKAEGLRINEAHIRASDAIALCGRKYSASMREEYRIAFAAEKIVLCLLEYATPTDLTPEAIGNIRRTLAR